jgi:hypothetical protein
MLHGYKNMLYGFIIDPETGKSVAVIRDGDVFCDCQRRSNNASLSGAKMHQRWRREYP